MIGSRSGFFGRVLPFAKLPHVFLQWEKYAMLVREIHQLVYIPFSSCFMGFAKESLGALM